MTPPQLQCRIVPGSGLVRACLSRTGCLAVLFGALAWSSPVLASEAGEKLVAAVFAFSQGELDQAEVLLDEAKDLTANANLLAKVHRQRGIIYDARDKRPEAVAAFMRAFYFDGDLRLNAREHRGTVSELFECARSLFLQGVKERTVKTQFREALEREEWTCPGAPEEWGETLGPDGQQSEPSPEDVVGVATPTTPTPLLFGTEMDGVMEPPASGPPSWPLWLGAGMGAAAMGTGAILGLSSLSRARDDNGSTDPAGSARGANVAFAVGGSILLATAGVWLWQTLFDDPTE